VWVWVLAMAVEAGSGVLARSIGAAS
jgi:hypothetical protein